MESVFNTVLNMSITGAYIAAFIIILRLLLKKLPKRYSYALWAILGIRLLCPFSFSSAVSIFNIFKPETAGGTMTYISEDIKYAASPHLSVGITSVNDAINTAVSGSLAPPPAEYAGSTNPMQVVYFICTSVWGAGVIAMLAYTVISYLLVRRRIKVSKHIGGNVFECSDIDTPFAFGIIKPRICLPEGVSEDDARYILAHEQAHIKRGDHIVKLIAMAALCLHWFNPLVWASYFIFVRDMELSCDERAVSGLSADERKEYANALLNISMRQNKIALGGILAFGESGIKPRIKNVLGSKEPALWTRALGVLAVAVAAVVLMTNSSAYIYVEADFVSPVDASDVKPSVTSADVSGNVPITSFDSEAVYKKPLKLFIENDGKTYETRLGVYSWDHAADNDAWAVETTSIASRFDLENDTFAYRLTDKNVRVQSEVLPDSVQVLVWSSDDIKNVSAQGEELTVGYSRDGISFTLLEGEYIYEINAEWDRKLYKGTATYRFGGVYEAD